MCIYGPVYLAVAQSKMRSLAVLVLLAVQVLGDTHEERVRHLGNVLDQINNITDPEAAATAAASELNHIYVGNEDPNLSKQLITQLSNVLLTPFYSFANKTRAEYMAELESLAVYLLRRLETTAEARLAPIKVALENAVNTILRCLTVYDMTYCMPIVTLLRLVHPGDLFKAAFEALHRLPKPADVRKNLNL